MTISEIILMIILAIVIFIALYTINWLRELNDNFIDKWDKTQIKLKAISKSGVMDSILDVDKFNDWFINNKDKNLYAHAGIFGRVDKLSQSHVEAYIFYATKGLVSYRDFNWNKLKEFEFKIKSDWRDLKKQKQI